MNELFDQIDVIKSMANKEVEALSAQIEAGLNKGWADWQELKDALSACIRSTNLILADYDSVQTFYRTDILGKIPKREQSYFDDYMSNECFQVDWENECLLYSLGPCILINAEGDIYDQDSREWIIRKDEYDGKRERNILIEAYMESTGCFPAVVQADSYDNLSFVKTSV